MFLFWGQAQWCSGGYFWFCTQGSILGLLFVRRVSFLLFSLLDPNLSVLSIYKIKTFRIVCYLNFLKIYENDGINLEIHLILFEIGHKGFVKRNLRTTNPVIAFLQLSNYFISEWLNRKFPKPTQKFSRMELLKSFPLNCPFHPINFYMILDIQRNKNQTSDKENFKLFFSLIIF